MTDAQLRSKVSEALSKLVEFRKFVDGIELETEFTSPNYHSVRELTRLVDKAEVMITDHLQAEFGGHFEAIAQKALDILNSK